MCARSACALICIAAASAGEYDLRTQLLGVWDGSLSIGGGPVEAAKFNLTVSSPDAVHGEVSVVRGAAFHVIELWTFAFAQGSNSSGVLIAHAAEGGDEEAAAEEEEEGEPLHGEDGELAAPGRGRPTMLQCPFSIASVGRLAAASVPLMELEDGEDAERGESEGGAARRLLPAPQPCSLVLTVAVPPRGAEPLPGARPATVTFVLVSSAPAASGGRLTLAAASRRDDSERRSQTLVQRYGYVGLIAVLLVVQVGSKVLFKERRAARLLAAGGTTSEAARSQLLRTARERRAAAAASAAAAAASGDAANAAGDDRVEDGDAAAGIAAVTGERATVEAKKER